MFIVEPSNGFTPPSSTVTTRDLYMFDDLSLFPFSPTLISSSLIYYGLFVLEDFLLVEGPLEPIAACISRSLELPLLSIEIILFACLEFNRLFLRLVVYSIIDLNISLVLDSFFLLPYVTAPTLP